MKIKVCGMTQVPNIAALLALRPDYLGFIFYEKSPRFVGTKLNATFLKNHFPANTKKVGVFVNASAESIRQAVSQYGLDLVQLHGDESPQYCRSLQGLSLIKAFRIGPGFSFSTLTPYKPYTDYFLFDTAGPTPGGNGVGFDWQLLEKYDHEKPFFLAGGIGPNDADRLLAWQASTGLRPHALDLNSRFELSPGMKNTAALQGFMQALHAEKPS